MEKSDFNEFKKVMFGIGEYYEKNISTIILDKYWSGLSDMDINQFKVAIRLHEVDTDQGMFFPKISHIIRQITGSSKDNEAVFTQSAELSWGKIIMQVQRVGSYGKLEIDDKLATETVKMIGGWRTICLSNNSQMAWLKREYLSLYKIALKRSSSTAKLIDQDAQDIKILNKK